MLTEIEIRRLLELLGEETVVAPSREFPFRISQRALGYRNGADGALQAKLSIMLDALGRRGG